MENIEEIDGVVLQSFSDVAKVIVKLIQENKALKNELRRTKEDKEENEAAYERILARYRKELNERRKKNA